MTPATRTIALTVNGEPRTVEVDVRMLLVEALRDVLDLTGTHLGCATGDCGCCSVRIDGRPAKSCLLLAVQADGAEVTTIEGLAPSRQQLHPVQQAFWDEHGFQCGFCLPGMLIAAEDLLARVPEPTEADVRKAIDGNLCRCTGYESIVKAIQAAAAAAREE